MTLVVNWELEYQVINPSSSLKKEISIWLLTPSQPRWIYQCDFVFEKKNRSDLFTNSRLFVCIVPVVASSSGSVANDANQCLVPSKDK